MAVPAPSTTAEHQKKKGLYEALIGPGGTLHFAGIDQGIDFTGSGPLYALAGGEITRVETGGTGWPGQGALVVEHLAAGPAGGKYVYYAEDLIPASGLTVGSKVAQGDVLATATGTGQAPGVEVGFAQASGVPEAPRPAPRPASQFTPEGARFLSFVENTASPLAPSSAFSAGTGSASDAGSFDLGGAGSFARDRANAGLAAGEDAAKKLAENPIPGSLGQLISLGGLGAGSTLAKFLGLPHLPSNWIQRSGEMLAGGLLILVGVVMVGRAASSGSGAVSQTTGAAKVVTRTVTRRAPSARRDAYGRRPAAPQPRTSVQRPARTRQVQLAADRRPRPRRGAPGSSQLAKGEALPF